MNRNDFLKLIGAGAANADYMPVACLLQVMAAAAPGSITP